MIGGQPSGALRTECSRACELDALEYARAELLEPRAKVAKAERRILDITAQRAALAKAAHRASFFGEPADISGRRSDPAGA